MEGKSRSRRRSRGAVGAGNSIGEEQREDIHPALSQRQRCSETWVEATGLAGHFQGKTTLLIKAVQHVIINLALCHKSRDSLTRLFEDSELSGGPAKTSFRLQAQLSIRRLRNIKNTLISSQPAHHLNHPVQDGFLRSEEVPSACR